ncbi:MAG: S8 family peptidase [Gemmatimonadota bacterium]|nr:S8 family peptidase [Gemmatimonadota bacterium]
MTSPGDAEAARNRRHLILNGSPSSEGFRSPGGGSTPGIPRRNRATHGQSLMRQFASAVEWARPATDANNVDGIHLQFDGFAGVELAFESLSRENQGIELLNVRRDGDRTKATVFVPLGKLAHFERMLSDYLNARIGRTGKSLDHWRLVETIESIRAGSIDALWTDSRDAFPQVATAPIWWEAWLPVLDSDGHPDARFRQHAVEREIRVSPGTVLFPERCVVLFRATVEQLKQAPEMLTCLAELRRAKETAAFFDRSTVSEQSAWVDDILARVRFAPPSANTPFVCLLDTGIASGHPLISESLDTGDTHTVDPAWGVGDDAGHGTEMAGLALFGDLSQVAANNARVDVGHRLESVKLLPRDGDTGTDPLHHAYLTLEAISRPEVAHPFRKRVFGMAVSARDNRDRGRPSAWSSAVDGAASDADGDGEAPRLILTSAGNADVAERGDYPHSNTTDSIHDPGQAWNAITVGSSTELTTIDEESSATLSPLATAGGLSPFSTTSATWDPEWPLKPDILLEGGNAGRDSLGTYTMPSLSLLTTYHRPYQRLFTTSCETSASTALAARMAAELAVAYPEFRPETIRALLVHSARWTPAMTAMFLPSEGTANKSHYISLVRHCGYGVPNLERALWSAANSLTLISEQRIQPFAKHGADVRLNEMHLHELPWPLEELESLGQEQVELRVTLSYFVEPNPSSRGRSRYSYQSHALRFDVKRADESLDGFRQRVNASARSDESESAPGGDDSGWLVGKSGRHRGSIHTDIWRGTAADLASRGIIGVYPATGWWKTRPRLGRHSRLAPYSLVVSIDAPSVSIDLYSAVASQVGITLET